MARAACLRPVQTMHFTGPGKGPGLPRAMRRSRSQSSVNTCAGQIRSGGLQAAEKVARALAEQQASINDKKRAYDECEADQTAADCASLKTELDALTADLHLLQAKLQSAYSASTGDLGRYVKQPRHQRC